MFTSLIEFQLFLFSRYKFKEAVRNVRSSFWKLVNRSCARFGSVCFGLDWISSVRLVTHSSQRKILCGVSHGLYVCAHICVLIRVNLCYAVQKHSTIAHAYFIATYVICMGDLEWVSYFQFCAVALSLSASLCPLFFFCFISLFSLSSSCTCTRTPKCINITLDFFFASEWFESLINMHFFYSLSLSQASFV